MDRRHLYMHRHTPAPPGLLHRAQILRALADDAASIVQIARRTVLAAAASPRQTPSEPPREEFCPSAFRTPVFHDTITLPVHDKPSVPASPPEKAAAGRHRGACIRKLVRACHGFVSGPGESADKHQAVTSSTSLRGVAGTGMPPATKVRCQARPYGTAWSPA